MLSLFLRLAPAWLLRVVPFVGSAARDWCYISKLTLLKMIYLIYVFFDIEQA